MIYTKPANDIGWDDVDSFCQEGIPEGAHLDYKRDFPSNLEKTIAAMANTLGGVILIGVEEDDESKPKLPLRGVKFQKGLSERVTSIILSNVTPPVFPDIAVCRNSDGDKAVVVIRVPQSHQTPHAINRNTQVYLRTGNRNSPEDLARIDEIEWLREHRRKSEDLRDQIYRRAIDRFQVIHQTD
jgi:predicted HTH transcriptional regulator